MTKIKTKMILRILSVGIVVFAIMHFTVLKKLTTKSDRLTIYNMYGAKYSDATLKRKIRGISNKNMNAYPDLISAASASICNDNTEILQLIDRKGGEFILQDMRSAYMCEANNSISFLEDKGFSVFDNDLQVPKFILHNAITHGEYDDSAMKHFKTLLDRHPDLKLNSKLIAIVEAIELTTWDKMEQERGKPPFRDTLFSYFSVEENEENADE